MRRGAVYCTCMYTCLCDSKFSRLDLCFQTLKVDWLIWRMGRGVMWLRFFNGVPRFNFRGEAGKRIFQQI